MTQQELSKLAADWISYWYAAENSAERLDLSDSTDLYNLTYHEPETLWLLILEIHRQDQSIAIQQVLSAGPIEDLLAQHGDLFIGRVEVEAQRDPSFAQVLGGVWQNSMSDQVWERLRKVWDRRGWDGIPDS